MTGVMIDADKAGTEGSGAPENEIDVLLQNGLKPVFISCKNGQTDSDEVYKVKSVSRRFGGVIAASALVINFNQGEQVAESLRRRCRLLKVTLIETYELSGRKLDNLLAGLAGSAGPARSIGPARSAESAESEGSARSAGSAGSAGSARG